MSSKNYFQVKKYRMLKKKSKKREKLSNDNYANCENRAEENIISDVKSKTDGDNLNLVFENTDNNIDSLFIDTKLDSSTSSDDDTKNYCALPNDNDSDDVPLAQSSALPRSELKVKLRAWALRNSNTLRHNVVSELLVLLREEGHVSLPKSARALLGTKRKRELKVMEGSSGTDGKYVYLGIERGLRKIITSDVYREDKISALIHIDGMQVYKSSKVTIWPIIVKIHHTDYAFEPFVASIFCGDSKPQSVEKYLRDFVMEINYLIQNGFELDNRKYQFEIMAITADSPARAFIKNCKAPGGFYACERCVTRGLSVGEAGHKTRVYPDMDCMKRTKKSFEEREQPEHHHKNPTPLLEILNFDPTKMVVLDTMHLLYLGVMKFLLERWILRKSPQRITVANVKSLQAKLDALTAHVPCEFQRKKFDIAIVSKWKATQFRFFLHYCGPAVMKDVISEDLYMHFLLLFVACRILNNRELLFSQIDVADELLRRFFYLLPSLYGLKSQVLSMHNLIHVADDVKTYHLPLIELSAFWGENYLGMFRNLVRTPHKPLTQIVNRLEELESGDQMKVRKRRDVTDAFITKSSEICRYGHQLLVTMTQVKIYGFTIKPYSPNNLVQLKNGKIFLVNKILAKHKEVTELYDIYMIGHEESKRRKVFNNPTSSINVHVVGVTKFTESEKQVCATDFKSKCVRLDVDDGIQWVISLLHTYD